MVKTKQHGQISDYKEHGEPDEQQIRELHIEDISFSTESIDGYAIYTNITLTIMKNVDIKGYSGDHATSINELYDVSNYDTNL